ncbi:MAG: DUF1003 domain-containing protein [Bacteroidetes bacterium]|nr:DUF1003 domain-containing protein [Bacteroidota bacterium]
MNNSTAYTIIALLFFIIGFITLDWYWFVAGIIINLLSFYWINKDKSKKELIFFSPFLILALLLFTRLIIFIPTYNRPLPDTFNIGFLLVAIFLFIWMSINTIWIIFGRTWDPYPFILLNFILSTVAAMQAPIILMSQNRTSQKDRARAEYDYWERCMLRRFFEPADGRRHELCRTRRR